MPRILAALLVVFLSPAFAADVIPGKGDKAPVALGTTLDGTTLDAGQYRGKVLVVTFWASWCGPCLKELPMLEGLQRAVGKDRLHVVAVNVEDRDVFRKVARKLESFTLTLAHDDRKRGSDAYGVKGIPHMVIIGRDGVIVKVNRGYSEEALEGILAEINSALVVAGAA